MKKPKPIDPLPEYADPAKPLRIRVSGNDLSGEIRRVEMAGALTLGLKCVTGHNALYDLSLMWTQPKQAELI